MGFSPATEVLANGLLHRNRQCVMVLADETSQIWADLAGCLEACGLSGSFLVFRRNVSAFGVVLEIAEDADSENVPGRALVADEDKVLRLFQRLSVGFFHLAFSVKVSKFAGQRDKHFHVEERARREGLAQVGDQRARSEQVLLPGDVFPKFAAG